MLIEPWPTAANVLLHKVSNGFQGAGFTKINFMARPTVSVLFGDIRF